MIREYLPSADQDGRICRGDRQAVVPIPDRAWGMAIPYAGAPPEVLAPRWG